MFRHNLLLFLVASASLVQAVYETAELKDLFERHKRDVENELNRMKKKNTKYVKWTPLTRKMNIDTQALERLSKETKIKTGDLLKRIAATEGEEEGSHLRGLFCPVTENTMFTARYGNSRTDGFQYAVNCEGPNFVFARQTNGQCNNFRPNTKHWGGFLAPFRRLVANTYADGRGNPQSSPRLPSARAVTASVHPDTDLPDVRITNILMQMGQFLDHDVTLAPEEDLECCEEEHANDPRCFNIEVNAGDRFFTENCLPLTRTETLCNNGEIREHFNAVTSFVDLSSVYGSDTNTSNYVRGPKRGGILLEGGLFQGALPSQREATGDAEFLPFEGEFFSGDIRVNEMPGLAVMHTLFFREHNRVARDLQSRLAGTPFANNDEAIYQSARRIVTAEWQHVVYNEFLPTVLGQDFMDKFRLDSAEDSVYAWWLNPDSLHSFGTAAFRFGHTLINGVVQKYQNGQVSDNYTLRSNFFNSEVLTQDGGDGLERLLEGLTLQSGQSFDEVITGEVVDRLFEGDAGDGHGQDLTARNLQRARDHGIMTYAEARSFCALSPLTSSWDDRPTEIPPQQWAKFQSVYSSPLDIEIFSAAVSEVPRRESLVGATFGCLIAYQFFLAKHGDRFFFTHSPTFFSQSITQRFATPDRDLYRQFVQGNGEELFKLLSGYKVGHTFVGGFSEEEKAVIRGRTLGDIICNNAPTIQETTKFVTLVRSGSNRVSACSERPAMDLTPFLRFPERLTL